MAKSYYTKADLLDFAREIVGDERRDKLRKEAARKFNSGIQGVTPWTTLVRVVTEEDFQNWKAKRDVD